MDLAAKISDFLLWLLSNFFCGYWDITIWKVNKIKTQILQATILNDHNFWFANENEIQLGTRMNIHKRLQKIPQYIIFKTHNSKYWFNQVGEQHQF